MSNGNDTAFPFFFPDQAGRSDLGLTKREYFCAAAIQGLCASENFDSRYPKTTATIAIELADALLKELYK